MIEVVENLQSSLVRGDPTVIAIFVAVIVGLLTVCKYLVYSFNLLIL